MPTIFDLVPHSTKVTITHPATSAPVCWIELVGKDSSEYKKALSQFLIDLGDRKFSDLSPDERLQMDATIVAALFKNWGDVEGGFGLPPFTSENVMRVLTAEGLEWFKAQISAALEVSENFFL